MDSSEASRIIESLRFGVPPDGYIGNFTVGRREEIKTLAAQLNTSGSNVLLLNANYGAGKSHLLRFVREEALRNGWMVSMVTLDAKSGVRFDQLSQIVGAICRGIEVPYRKQKGIRQLLDTFKDFASTGRLDKEFWAKLHNKSTWDRRQHFETEAFYIGLRAWLFCDPDVELTIENWLQSPHMNCDGRKKNIHSLLVEGMRRYFRDSRPKSYFTKEQIELTGNDKLCWAFIRDLHLAARAIGLKGLVLCFDEFEDIIYNLSRTEQKKMAFCNMFELFYEDHFQAHAYFAVTPGFVSKCKKELQRKGEYDYDFSRFDRLSQFEMSPIGKPSMKSLVRKIVATHSVAFSWKPDESCHKTIANIVEQFSRDFNQDRVRQCVRKVVQELDRSLES